MPFFELLFGKKTSNVDTEIDNIFNEGEAFENELLEKYGKCKPYQKFNLNVLFITDTHNCLAYTDKFKIYKYYRL